MSDPRVAAAHVRARFTAAWLASHVQDAPTMVRKFLYEDVPHLFGLLDGLIDEPAQPTGIDQIVETVRMADLLVELVRLARLANEATATGADPMLWRARESDLQEGLGGLCPHRQAILADVAVRALAETGWPGVAPQVAGNEWLEPER